MSAVGVFGLCGVSTTARRSSSNQMLVCEVARAQPHSGFPSVSQLRCGIPRSFSHLWKVSKHRFAELQQLSTIRTTRGSIEWRLYIVSPETRNEPSCMSNNPLHQCTVSGRSVLCAVLKCCQHCAHLSLQLFFDSFPLLRFCVIVLDNIG